MAKRIISALLLAASIITFTACSSDSGNTSDTTVNAAELSDTTAAETTDSRIKPDLPEADFDSYNFRVLTKGTANMHWKSRDIAA